MNKQKEVILKLENFSKSFRSQWTFRPLEAVKNINLEVYRGEAFGFLGHNGAGKTTTMKAIVGLISKTAGKIYLDGKELVSAEQHRMLGYLPEQPYFYDHLTVEETLDFFASLHGLPDKQRRISEVLETVGLSGDRKRSSVRSLSKGLQQRVGLAQAIINRPKILLLDEPFSGLDPLGRLEFRKVILDLKKEGTTIFLSSHILSDIEDICDRVSIMARGELKTVFNLEETPSLFGETFELTIQNSPENAQFAATISKLAAETKTEDSATCSYHIFKFSDYASAQAALGQAIANGIRVDEFRSCGLSLEEIFMNITGDSSKKLNDLSDGNSTNAKTSDVTTH